MKPRSPVLGYNHNVRYASMLWHVQTEDSGVHNPHIFTHLFHDGTILSSKKLNYDASSEVSIVQKLMQSQHKQMLRELKSGGLDAKIVALYGPIKRETGDTDKSIPVQPAEPVAESVDIDVDIEITPAPTATPTPPPAVTPPPAPVRGRSPEDDRPTVPDLTPLLTPLLSPPPARPPTGSPEAPRARASLTPSRPAIAVTARAGSGAHPTTASPPPTIGGRAAARSAPPTIGSGRSGAAQTNRPTAEGVIVGRPTVIVGKESGNKQTENFWKTERRQPPEPAFGGDLISEKSLDEVILAYLSEDAPKK